MTDSEIIKSLECCMNDSKDCWECPYRQYCPECLTKQSKDIINLINRQQKEIENLKIENQSLRSAANSYKIHYDKARAEAIKEFAERAKEHFLKLEYKANTKRKTVKVEELEEQMEWVLHTVAIKTLDNLVKEMAGDTE